MSKRKEQKPPFKVGDKVVPKHGEKTVLTVLWTSKNDTSRDEQLIATERNGYCHSASYASLFEEAAQ